MHIYKYLYINNIVNTVTKSAVEEGSWREDEEGRAAETDRARERERQAFLAEEEYDDEARRVLKIETISSPQSVAEQVNKLQQQQPKEEEEEENKECPFIF